MRRNEIDFKLGILGKWGKKRKIAHEPRTTTPNKKRDWPKDNILGSTILMTKIVYNIKSRKQTNNTNKLQKIR